MSSFLNEIPNYLLLLHIRLFIKIMSTKRIVGNNLTENIVQRNFALGLLRKSSFSEQYFVICED